MSAGPTLIGRYEIVSRIGQGGMGSLFLAWDPLLERQIAIKLLREGFDNDELRERFAREARSAARLRHPNIVTIFDVGAHNGQPFIAMEYIQGQTLADVVRTAVPPTTIRTLQLVEEVCAGLAFAHNAGIVHRDVKPANLMVDTEGALKILDFGIARVAESGMTQAGMLIGTLNYMSPEQVSGSPADRRSDIFAVGAVFYELLACKQAFPGNMETGILNRLLHVDPEPLEKVSPGLDGEIVRIVARSLEKDPRNRYQELLAMRKDVLRVRQRLEAAEPDSDDVPTMTGDVVTFLETRPAQTPTPRTPRRGTDRQELARRRASQIDAHIEAARRALATEDYDAAIAGCEQALMLDTDEPRAGDLLDRARTALDERQVRDWLEQAEEEHRRGALVAALSLVNQAIGLSPESARATDLKRELEEAVRARERARLRAGAIHTALERASVSFDKGAFEQAAAAAEEALALDASLTDAADLKARALEAIEARRREALERRARQTVDEARRLAKTGDHPDALALLARFEPAHELVSRAALEIRTEADAIAQRLDEERRVEEERQRREADRLAREQRIAAGVQDARAAMARGNFDAAVACVQKLQETDPDVPEAAPLLVEAEHGRAHQVSRSARELFTRGEHQAAIGILTAFTPPHAVVSAALLELRSEIEEIERRKEQARRLQEEQQRQERARLEVERRRAEEQRRLEAQRAEEERRLQAQRAEEERRIEAERATTRRRVEGELQQARSAIERQDFNNALSRLRQLHRSDPDVGEVQPLIAEAEMRQAAAERARQVAHQLAALLAQATDRLIRHDLTGATSRVDAALQLDPRHEGARQVRAKIQDAVRVAAEAREAEQRRLRERRRAVADALDRARHAASHETALADLHEALGLDPTNAEAKRLVNIRQRALDEQRSEDTRLRRIEEARRTVEELVECGDLDGAERVLSVAEKKLKAKKLLEPVRARLQSARAQAAAKTRAAADATQSPPELLATAVGPPPQPIAPPPPIDQGEQAVHRLASLGMAPGFESSEPNGTALDLQRPQRDKRFPVVPAAPHPRHVGPAALAAAAIVVLALAGVGYRLITGDQRAPVLGPAAPAPTTSVGPPATPAITIPTPPPAAQPAAPHVTSAPTIVVTPAHRQLAPLIQRGRQQQARGELAQALATATGGLKTAPDDEGLNSLVQDLARDARRRVLRARSAAEQAGPEVVASRSFKEAIRNEADATRLARTGRMDQAVRSLIVAEGLFKAAGEVAQTARVEIAPPPPPPPVSTQVIDTPPPAPAPPSSTTSPSRSLPSSIPPTPTAAPASAVNEEAPIRAALQAYERGFNELDVAAVQRVYPSVNAALLANGFSQLKEQRVLIQVEQIEVNGAAATVRCTVRQSVTPKAGRSRGAPAVRALFRLQKTGSAWIIVERR